MTESDAEQFRQEAEDCRLQAEKATNPTDKEAWLKLAEAAAAGITFRRVNKG